MTEKERIVGEKMPLKLRRPHSYYVLTASQVEDAPTVNQHARRITATEQCLIKCSQAVPEKPPLPGFDKICPVLQSVVDERLRRARKSGDPAPVMVAFTVLANVHYANVVDVAKFESTAEFRYQREQYEVAPQAISQDQLLLDMEQCQREYVGICTVLAYLAQMEWKLHTVIRREVYRVKNMKAENFIQYWRQPCIKGYYYKILVDFGQS